MAGASIGAGNSTYWYGFTAGQRVNREDLLDLITNLDPWDTPWVSQAPKVRATHVNHEWLVDTLPATSTAGAVEGGEFGIDTNTLPRRKLNNTQIFRRDVAVSETQRSVNPAGFKDAYAYRVQKSTKAIARNIEATLFSDAASASGLSSTARILRTFQDLSFMVTSLAQSTDASGPIGAVAADQFSNTMTLGDDLTNPALANMTNAGILAEWEFNTLLETVYRNGGNPDSVFVSPGVKKHISSYGAPKNSLGVNQRRIEAGEKKLVAAVDVYDSDYGLIQVIQDRWVPEGSLAGSTSTAHGGGASAVDGRAFALERGNNRLAWLRPVQHIILGKSGDSVRGIVLGEVTLEVLSEKANGYWANVTTPSSYVQITAQQ